MKWTNSLKENLPKLIQEIDNLTRPISSKEIESIINNFPKQKTPGFTGELYQTFKEEIIPMVCNLFPRSRENTS